MKITIITGPFLPCPPGKAGAVERRWCGTANEFVARGHKVVVICRELDKGEVYPQGDVEYVPIPGFRATGCLPLDLVKDFWYSMRAARAIKSTDVVVLNSFWLPVVTPLYTHLRSDSLICYNLARHPKRQLGLYRNIDLILAVSQAVGSAASRQSPQLSKKVRVVSNPIDTTVFHLDGRTRKPSGRKILYAGRIHPEKGLELLIRACKLLAEEIPEIQLLIHGESAVERGGGGRSYVDKLSSLCGNAFRMTIGAAIYDRCQLADIMRNADVFCYPSIAESGESFGVAPLEAMAVGCPVVVSALECFNDFIVHGKNGLVFDHRLPQATNLLCDQLRLILTQPTYAQALGNAAAEHALNFSYQRIADRYLCLFEEEVDKKREKGSPPSGRAIL